MNAFKLKIAVALAALVAGAAAQAATDGSQVTNQSVAVKYTRAELADDLGTAAVYARLGTAARAVCGAKSAVLAELAQWQRCRAQALEDAVADINDARLSALHRGAVPKRMLAQNSVASEQTGS